MLRLPPPLLTRTSSTPSSLPSTLAALLNSNPPSPPPPHLLSRLTPTLAAQTLHLLLRSHNLSPALAFLRSHSHLLPDHASHSLIRRLSRAGHLTKSISVFNNIPSPTVYSYNAILSAVLRRGRTRSALRLYSSMLRANVRPDTCTFNTLIRGFCLNGSLDEGFHFFTEMSRRGVPPDIITYNTLLHGLCLAGKVSTARNMFNGMKTKNPVTYTTMIRGYFVKNLCDEAVALFGEMAEPNRITYNNVIHGLCEARRMDLVKEVFKRQDFKPDACTFNTLIAAHCNAGAIGEAMRVFDGMMEMRVKTDSASYSTLIRALCRSGEFGRAEELVDEMLEKGVLARRGVCVPLIAPYNPMFEYLCSNGRAEKARRLFRGLLERKAKVDVVAFKTLILGHCKEGAFDEGYKLLCSMTRRDLKPDMETCMSLIDGCLRREKALLAWCALKRMSFCGHRPSTSTFHVVLASLLNKGSYAEEAGDLVKLLLERRIRQNIDLSTDVVSALFRNGLTDRAFEIVGLIYDSGYGLKMEKLVECLCEDKKFMDARKLLLFCLEKHPNLDVMLYDMVVKGLCVTGRAPEAFELFYEMNERRGCCEILKGLDDFKMCSRRQWGGQKKQILCQNNCFVQALRAIYELDWPCMFAIS